MPELTDPEIDVSQSVIIDLGNPYDAGPPADPSSVDLKSVWFEALRSKDGSLQGLTVNLAVYGLMSHARAGANYSVYWVTSQRGVCPDTPEGYLGGKVDFVYGGHATLVQSCSENTVAITTGGVSFGCRCQRFEIADPLVGEHEISWSLTLAELQQGWGETIYHAGAKLAAVKAGSNVRSTGVNGFEDDAGPGATFVFG